MARNMRLSHTLLFLFIIGTCVLHGISNAETFVLQPGPEGKDAGVRGYSEYSGMNFGDAEWFYGIGIASMAAAFIEFDLSSIPAGSTINSAIITLWAAYQDGTIYFKPVLSPWDEMTITWDNQPATVPNEVSYPISRGAPDGDCYWGCPWDFDITSIVQYWVDNSNIGLMVYADTSSGWLMASSDNLTRATPKLTVEYGTVSVEQTSWGAIKRLYR